MPKKYMKQLEAIHKQLAALRDVNEDDFANCFYYVDFLIGVNSAIAKLDTTMFNATI